MGRQYNRRIKRARSRARLKRRKEGLKLKKAAALTASAPAAPVVA